MAQKSHKTREAVKHGIMWFILFFAFFPLYVMVVISFKGNNQFTDNPWFFDPIANWHWENWLDRLQRGEALHRQLHRD